MSSLTSLHFLAVRVWLVVGLYLVLIHSGTIAQELETVFSDNRGRYPVASLVQGSDGSFYGTTREGGASSSGTVFKITSAGTLTTLHYFTSVDGQYPTAGLVLGSDGSFYSTTRLGGAYGSGTVFKITSAGVLTTLHSFDSSQGRFPEAGLVQGSDGSFYGNTTDGGAHGFGTVFKITAGGRLTTLHSFNGTDGDNPLAGLVQGSDGNFYGTTQVGGANGYGTVFKITPTGALTTLHSFSSNDGSSPQAELLLASDGSFYGTTFEGGASGYGTVFKITPTGTLTSLYSFHSTDGRSPRAGLVLGADGSFFGCTSQGGANSYGTVFKITSTGTLTTLFSFDSTRGSYPYARLVLATDGNFYGTTYSGTRYGTVFKITPMGTLTTLHSFRSDRGSDPQAGLVVGDDGNLYGTTYRDGTRGGGTVFRVTPAGILTTLHSFSLSTGSFPFAGLIKGSDGSFYGTTEAGGVTAGGLSTNGTVYKITSSGTLTTLYGFPTGTNSPRAGLLQGTDGNFYGTTAGYPVEGAGFPSPQAGRVFRMTPSGTLTTLHTFTSTTGSNPFAGLVEGSDGNFYGTASEGGTYDRGTVFKITPTGTVTTLHHFQHTDGSRPYAGLVKGSDGSFYGTSAYGGAPTDGIWVGPTGNGTVFKITPEGALTKLHTFNASNGRNPRSGLVEGSGGSFYGTTVNGGAYGFGTLFKISPGGTHEVIHSFDGTTAAYPRGTPIFGPDGKLYGTSGQMAIWRFPLNSPSTATPTLTAPFTNAFTESPIRVFFTLPEAALPGSVKLAFGATKLTLASSQETAGKHAFTFHPGNPTFSEQVASGSAIGSGSYTVTLSYQDAAGNPVANVSATNVTVDATAPTLSPVTISSNNAISTRAKDGDTVTVSFTTTEAIRNPSVTLLGVAATVSNSSGNHWTATANVGAGTAQGNATFSIQATDLAGNAAAAAVTATTNASSVTVDKNPPSFSNVTIASNNAHPTRAKQGDMVTVSFTTNEGIQTPSVTVLGVPANVANPSGNSWTASAVVDTSTAQGAATFSINGVDLAGNAATTITATTNASSVMVDKVAPTLSLVSIASNNGNTSIARLGNVVSLSFTTNETVQTPSVTLLGVAAAVTNPSGNTWTASATVTAGTAQGPAAFSIVATDLTGNIAAPVTATTNASSVTVDRTTQPPFLTNPVTNAANSSLISVSFMLPEAASNGTVKLAFGATILTLANSQGTVGPHSFTFPPSNPTASPQIGTGVPIVDGSYTVTLSYQDSLGNPAASSAAANNVVIDTMGPVGGSMILTPASPVARSSPIAVTFANWVDGRSPLSYEILIDNVVVSRSGSDSSRQLRAPSTATGPTSYSLKGRIRDTLGNTTEVTQSIDVFLTPGQQQFSADILSAGLTGPDVAATSSPQNDGVTNLEKYAFNLDLLSRDRRTLTPGTGTAGLPVITFPSAGVMRVEYLRRIGSGLIYTPKKGTSPQPGSWQNLSAPGTVTPIDANWERVQHDEFFTPSSTPAMYGTVEVTLP